MTRILIADDHALFRAGLRQLLSDVEDMEVVGEAGTAAETLDCLGRLDLNLDLVLLDISLPDKSGIETLKAIKATRPELPVMILTMHAEDQYGVRLLRDGAHGYMTKESAPAQLISAIRKVAQGKKYVSPQLAEILVQEVGNDTGAPLHESLSQREFQILCKLATGKTVSEIAQELFLSVKTVSTYRARILEKMKMRNNAELMYYAIKEHLVE